MNTSLAAEQKFVRGILFIILDWVIQRVTHLLVEGSTPSLSAECATSSFGAFIICEYIT